MCDCRTLAQGDGIDINVMRDISTAVEQAGYSAENVAFGMGGGLLQKVERWCNVYCVGWTIWLCCKYQPCIPA